uniref:Uncharacterized protein n=1 Tax=Ditylum brightwellii TaxID=49249 RepID=A0A7S4VXJ7_9STRA|mmetsp:Transcript_6153/g.8080  ORF Transcript_6153/g.8080 Transcript_6153/m.8080 type:complete len:338 (+) Transcript_6153:120-1133(+)
MTAIQMNMTTNANKKQGKAVWKLPWVVFFIFLYIYILFLINYSIIRRYYIRMEWNEALPGLDKTFMRKVTMKSHMTAGALAILLGPLQFVSYFRKHPRLRLIHRWSGRLYCVCGMLSSVFGLWFIALKKSLVGGINMTISFSLAGITIGALSFKAWQTARAAKWNSNGENNSGNSHNNKAALFQTHRNWAIRSYAQILGPALYRYWYTILLLTGLYRGPSLVADGLQCDENGVCPEYKRPFDNFFCWAYWVSAGLVAEIIIYYLPTTDELNIPFSETSETTSLISSANDSETETTAINSKGNASAFNLVGCLLAGIAVVVTGDIFYIIFSGSAKNET